MSRVRRLALAFGLCLVAVVPASAHRVAHQGTITCATTPTLIVSANPSTIALSVINNATVTIFVGDNTLATLTTANGWPLALGTASAPGGAWFSTPGFQGPLYCIVAAATANLRYVHEVE